MRSPLKNNCGAMLLEMTLAAVVSVIGAAAVSKGLVQVLGLEKRMGYEKTMEFELTRAVGNILRVGRIAQNCRRIVDTQAPYKDILEGQVDRNIPPTASGADDTVFRFKMNSNGFSWLRQQGAAFVPYVSYSFIQGFEVCDDTRIKSTTSPCPIPQTAISNRQVANLTAAQFQTDANRFFRFQLTAVDPKESMKRQLQSAFWIRHPAPSGALYQWGLMGE